jgi:3-isopropylmalate dehydrogenase
VFEQAASAIEQAVEAAVAAHEVTADIGGKLGTRETGAALAGRVERA